MSSAPPPPCPSGLCCLRFSCNGGMSMSDYNDSIQFKRRKVSCDSEGFQLSTASSRTFLLPVCISPDYYLRPSICELMAREVSEKNYCSRVKDFAVGRLGYGHVKFFGETDVRGLNVDKIVSFNRHEVIVYGDESRKPAVGQGLNKAAEVTLVLQIALPVSDDRKLDALVRLLKISTERQGANFISFDAASGEWIFSVQHFSRFGLTDEEEEDIIMDDVVLHEPSEPSERELNREVENQFSPDEAVLSHSLPSHLGLDPLKVQKLRFFMFPEEDVEELPSSQIVCVRSNSFSNGKKTYKPAYSHTPKEKPGSSPARKSPLALVEYMKNSDMLPQRNILMIGQNKGLPIRTTKVEGFKLNPNLDTPLTKYQSRNVVDAALFMGKSFRVGWGPNGILFHSGCPVNSPGFTCGLSSTIHVEKVAFDGFVRDENSKVKEELVDFCFSSPLELHKSFSYPTDESVTGSLKLRKLVLDRQKLSKVCDGYIELIRGQIDLSSPTHFLADHQAIIWELIKVLFADNERNHQLDIDEEDVMDQRIDSQEEIDIEAYPLVRRARFSNWLRLSVRHRVQKEVSSLHEPNGLQHIFSLLTGRELDSAVELAASTGDVRMACLLSQAGGSMVSRSDMARQLEIWKSNGLDFNFIENDRVRLYELLAGNIHGALQDSDIDWKRYIGLLMWYQLAPDTSLPVIVRTYQQLLSEGRAPYPVPIYVDERSLDGAPECSPGDRFDIAFYLLLLHADMGKDHKFLNIMFSAYSSTSDSLDYHMIWHQRALLEAIGVFSSKDLHIVDMSFISQLLCVGLCHWAIYAVLHIPYCDDFPYLHSRVIREILFQYCETWSTDEVQQRIIEDLGIPSEWLHEALAVFYEYHKDEGKALEHYLRCFKWQKAHMIFMTSVAPSLFISSQHSQVWQLATDMEEHKSEIADWDLGAGIYISFYLLKNSLQVDIGSNELESLEEKSDACKLFIGRLNESLSVWGNRIPIDTRYTYSKMAEELFSVLVANNWEDSTRDVQLASFDTMLMAPIPEDKRSCHLQDALSVFTYFLSESVVP